MEPSTPTNLEEYSAFATIINFDYPLPLLRGSIPASTSDDPSSGTYVLAFRNPQSWEIAYKFTKSKLISQCEGGARIGCAISASEKCKMPWWKNLIGGAKLPDLKEKEECEEREMEGCLAAGKEKCAIFAKDKCLKPFYDARIAVGEERVVKKLVCSASLPERSRSIHNLVSLIGFDNCETEITNLKASELLANDPKYQWFFKQS